MSKRKLKSIEVLQQMKDFMKPNMLYRTEYIAKMLGFSLPNTRRYLRRLVKYGLLEVYKRPKIFGKYKFYKLVAAKSQSPFNGDKSKIYEKEVKKDESKSRNLEESGELESEARNTERNLESAIATIDKRCEETKPNVDI